MMMKVIARGGEWEERNDLLHSSTSRLENREQQERRIGAREAETTEVGARWQMDERRHDDRETDGWYGSHWAVAVAAATTAAAARYALNTTESKCG
jgi:hypothetical protein